ncbi:MAG: T9SS type A sorting domain-containing protein [Candidatus Eisenbacteria bacterium]|uniref:T9SS type A sorting domain-containing protein n=1 Tax=Eiseniibacteriota bacterium TaxID=2212470 RepID=A0A948W2H3_UNCEI|nr:T9SS type A sorting domain-containing protein [Candidatus Eisenbacteria bacterium]MBU1949502.1 T9SS type A sorting domain-containing protein [Candidatus Eisenbacteria bacterium]MBU2689947.1 T9SS type A sorting domain-containing protein [Candidatus Eisenbacteria bacterium]
MDNIRQFLIFIIGIVILLWSCSGVAQEYQLYPSVLDASGGIVCGAPDHDLLFTLGEPVVGLSENQNFQLWSGFRFLRRVTVLCPGVSGVDDAGEKIITDKRLYPAYPNPATGSVRLRFDLSSPSHVTLVVYDLRGRVVRTLERGLVQPGRHEATWDGIDNNGHLVATGIYFARLAAGNTEEVRRLVVLR